MAHFSSLLSLLVLLPSILSVQGVVVPSDDGSNFPESILSDTAIASQIVASATELASSLAPALGSSGGLPTGLPLPGASGLPGILPGGPSALPFAGSAFPSALPSNFAPPPLGSDAPIPTALHHSIPLPKELRDEGSDHLVARKAKTKASSTPKATSKSAAKTTKAATTSAKTTKAATTSAKTTKAATSAKTTAAATSAKTSKAATSSKASNTSKAATASAGTTSKAATSSGSKTSSAQPTSSSAACNLRRAGTAGVAARADCQTCDPCDDACDSNVSEISTRRRSVEDAAAAGNIRVLYGNETLPFLPNEHVRVRMIEGRANPTLEFDCSANGIPEVCQNMCYGVNCRGHPQTLTRNTGNKKTCAAARKQNSCGASPNRCSVKKGATAGQSCDEYPFASTKEGQAAGTGGKTSAVTRCVPAGQNSSQGGKISGIYRSIADGTQYDIKFDFGGAAGTGYCAAQPDCSKLTGTQSNN